MNRKKITKYEIGQSSQFVNLSMYYITKTNTNIIQDYVITQDLLDEYDVSFMKFVDYLRGQLPKADRFYKSCDEIFLSNGPVASKVTAKLNHDHKRTIKNIVYIFIGNEVIDLNGNEKIK